MTKPLSFQIPGYREIDFDFEGIPVHAWEGGSGQPLILVHGSGAGCQTLSNWKAVMQPLALRYHVLAADLVGFGLSGWKMTAPLFDMALWGRQIVAMMARFPGARVALVGHSFAGPLVLRIAATSADVAGVVVTGTAGRASLPNSGGPGWRFPDDAAMLRKGVGRTVVNAILVDDDEIDRRMYILGRPGARENFNGMFGGDKQSLVEGMTLTDDELRAIKCPVTFLHGKQDASFSYLDTSLPMSDLVEGSDIQILDRCAHSVALEHPAKFIAAVDLTLGTNAI